MKLTLQGHTRIICSLVLVVLQHFEKTAAESKKLGIAFKGVRYNRKKILANNQN